MTSAASGPSLRICWRAGTRAREAARGRGGGGGVICVARGGVGFPPGARTPAAGAGGSGRGFAGVRGGDGVDGEDVLELEVAHEGAEMFVDLAGVLAAEGDEVGLGKVDAGGHAAGAVAAVDAELDAVGLAEHGAAGGLHEVDVVVF